MASSKIDMSLDQIIKMGRKQGAPGGRQRGGPSRNRGGRRNNYSGPGPIRNPQQHARGRQQQQQQQWHDTRNFEDSRGRRRRRRRAGPNQQAPQIQRQQIASVVQRPSGNPSASGVRYNMKTGRVRRGRAQNRDGPRGTEGQRQGRVLGKQATLVERGGGPRSGRARPPARGAQRGYRGQPGSGPAGATGTMRERAALVRRLLERARKRESQTHARETAVMQKRGLAGAPAAKQQSSVRAARKRVAAATRRSQFSAALRRGAPPRSNLKVSVAVDALPAQSKEPRRSQLVRKYRAEARKLIDAVKNSLHGGQPTVSN